MKKFSYLVIFLILFLNSCGKEEKDISLIKENSQDLEMISTYKEAYKAMNSAWEKAGKENKVSNKKSYWEE